MATEKEHIEVMMKCFYIKTDMSKLKQFLSELENVCQRFAVKDGDKPDYGFQWEGI